METLVKFCKTEHNILKGCHTIQFGTLEYYREYGPNFTIADEEEGKESTDVVSFQSDTASREAKESLQWVVSTDSPGILLQDCKVETTVPNCFIWCCSRASKPISVEQGARFDSDYKSFYEIPDGDRFGKHLTSLLGDCVLGRFISSTPKDCIRGLSLSQRKGEVALGMVHHDVTYVNEKKSVIDEGQWYPYAENIPSPYRPLFVKTKTYEEQREHRFVFWFYNKKDGRVLAVQQEPLILSIDPVSRTLIDQTLSANSGE